MAFLFGVKQWDPLAFIQTDLYCAPAALLAVWAAARRWATGHVETAWGQKNAGLKAVTLIATLNPVSQVLW
jgi:hypothetical protein